MSIYANITYIIMTKFVLTSDPTKILKNIIVLEDKTVKIFVYVFVGRYIISIISSFD